MKELNLVSCPGAKEFTDRVFKWTKKRNKSTNLISTDFVLFKNGECKCILNDGVRGSDIFIFQDISNHETGSVNDNLVQLLTAIDSVNHASAEEINVVIPTFPYSRQHKKTKREGLTAALWCHIFENMRVKRIITLDIHSREIQNAFSHTIMENLHASYQLIRTMKEDGVDLKNLVVVAPDSGAIERNKFFASNLKVPLAMLYKERDYSKVTTSSSDTNIVSQKLIGDIDHSSILIFDDMCDTGGTLLKAARFLKEKGADKVYFAVSLPFFNDPALEDFDQAKKNEVFEKVYGTNAVMNKRLWSRPWFKKSDVTELFGDVVLRVNDKVGLSDVLERSDDIQRLLNNFED